MLPVVLALAMFLIAFAIPYHTPRLGVVMGGLGMAVAVVLVLNAPAAPGEPPRPSHFDFEMSRPIGIALALYSLLWLLVAAVQLTRVRTPAR